MIRATLLLLLFSFHSVHGFLHPSKTCANTLLLESKNDYDGIREAASAKLTWENTEESASRPILRLSDRDLSPEEDTIISSSGDWDQGQLWEETKQGLIDRSVANPEEFLQKCPQLFRLDPKMVLESTDLVIQEYGLEYLVSEPRLLAYRSEHIAYGLEFMSTMMMMDARVACQSSPALLISGIEGGIQERAVQAALGAAGAATSQAHQKIAGEAMSALKSLKKKKGL